MIYYQSKYLAEKLDINLAKWKRWSRSFLPPDPLGGLQSGVARQFTLKEAFKVYFGGYMVARLKFTIPEAQRILNDLSPWLRSHGYFQFQAENHRSDGRKASEERHLLYIHPTANGRFAYSLRSLHCCGPVDAHQQEIYDQTLVHTDADPLIDGCGLSAQVVAVSALYQKFLEGLDV